MASLPAAVLAARRQRAVEIVLRAGEYRLDAPVTLGPDDADLTIRSEPGKRARIVGAASIPPGAVHPCRDRAVLNRIIDVGARSRVEEVDLKRLGVGELAPMQTRGFSFSPPASPNELFAGQTPLTLARWPNKGYAKIGSIIEPGNGETDSDKPMRKPVFLAGDRPKLWANAHDVWLYGYWKFDWADEAMPVDGINGQTGAITLAHPHPFGVAKDAPFYAENLLEELDAPGEYYLDRSSDRLYFIPPDGPSQPLRLSTMGVPFIDASKSSNLTIVGIDFAFSRGDAVHFTDCERTTVAGCRFFDLGGKAVVVKGGKRTGVQSCDIWDTGEGGVVLNAGDRAKLESAEDYVDNCEIYDYQRRSQTYRPAVSLDGCGNRVTHCTIHDAPHSAIIYWGNNHVLADNDVYRVLSQTGDGGAFYTGRDWTARGTVISGNYFHDDVGQRKWEPAVYLDDLACGITVTGNTIERCHWGFLIGGGRDNKVVGNTIIDCDVAFTCDARGLGWGANMRPVLTERLKALPYQAEPWKSAYPTLIDILDQNPMAPSGNVIDRNFLANSGKVDASMEAPFRATCEIKDNVSVAKKLDLVDFPGFKRLDPKTVGVFRDRYRSSLRG